VRSILTAITIAIGVAGIGTLAIPSILDRAMADRVARHRIFDAWVATVDVPVDGPRLAELRAVPNVSDLEARAVFRTRIRVGARRADALVIGVPDFARQTVDAVEVVSGRVPAEGEALVDPAARRAGRWTGGTRVRLVDSAGRETSLAVVGQGQSLEYTAEGDVRGAVVVYAPERSVEQLAGFRGPNAFAVHFRDRGSAAVETTLTELHARLDAVVGRNSFLGLPLVRPGDTWPGQDGVQKYDTFLLVIAAVAMASSIYLIANTMNTLVSEQRREIGIMKALGGRRRTIYGSFLRTAALFGLAGGIAGAVLSVVTANVMARYVGGLMGVRPGIALPVGVATVALATAVVVAIVAALPALRRANAVNVREALGDEAAASYGRFPLDRLLRRVHAGPMATIGLRSVTRRPGRTASTALQVAVAVAVIITFLSLRHKAVALTTQTWQQLTQDLDVRADTTSKPLDASTLAGVRAVPGVAGVETVFTTAFAVGGERLEAWGLAPGATLYRPKVVDGRWLAPADSADGGGRVAVVGSAIARLRHLTVGGPVDADTPGGVVRFTVVGIDDSLMNNGRSFFVPLATMRSIVGDPAAANSYWVTSVDHADAAVDRLAARIEQQLVASGHSVGVDILHVRRAENVAAGRSITQSITAFGLLIVAISMIGLVNAVTMNVIDRTREVGVLRCIGGRARDLGRAFRVEGLLVSVTGWAVGVPLGYVGARLLTQVVFEVFDFRYRFEFLTMTIPITLAGAVLLSTVVLVVPVRRATRLHPGAALRYQ
jgi:putative ABC transport system permease protein